MNRKHLFEALRLPLVFVLFAPVHVSVAYSLDVFISGSFWLLIHCPLAKCVHSWFALLVAGGLNANMFHGSRLSLL